MPDKNPAEKINEISLKTQSDFNTPLSCKPKSCQGFDGNLWATYLFNIPEKFIAKQGNVMSNFAEVLAESQSKNFILLVYNEVKTKYLAI